MCNIFTSCSVCVCMCVSYVGCLANVIYALTETSPGSGTGARHVPYRDSKLTRLLQDSLVSH